MAFLQKIKQIRYIDASGKRVSSKTKGAKRIVEQSAKWYGIYKLDGVTQKVPLAKDKDAAKTMLSDLVKRAERREAGLLDPYEEFRKLPLCKHVEDFEAVLIAKGNTKAYSQKTANRCKLLFEGIRATKLNDLRSHDAEQWLAKQREAGLSRTTANYYATAIKGFGNWLVRDKRAPSNPFAHLGKVQVLEATFERRTLSTEEAAKLIAATERSTTTFRGLNGPARAMLYRVALGSGFRAAELASLSLNSLNLNGEAPAIHLAAKSSKRRKADLQPITRELADALQAFAGVVRSSYAPIGYARGKAKKTPERPVVAFPGNRATKSPTDAANAGDAKLWPGTWCVKAAAMIRGDAEAAGIELEGGDGVLDFHSLRHSFVSNLAKAGVHPRTAQELARHSDIKLTMARYTHLELRDLSSALEGLPKLPTVEVEAVRATGTEDAKPSPTRKPTYLERKGLVPLQNASMVVSLVALNSGKPRQPKGTVVQCADRRPGLGESEDNQRKAIRENALGADCPLLPKEEKEEAPVGVEPTMRDLQSLALATWPRRHEPRNLGNS